MLSWSDKQNVENENWYEYGCDEVSNLLLKLTEKDWEILSENILNESVAYQEKLAYCMSNKNNKNEFELLLHMVKNTKNAIIFEACMWSLVDFITSETRSRILNDQKFMVLITSGRVKKEKRINSVYKTIYDQFFEKLDIY